MRAFLPLRKGPLLQSLDEERGATGLENLRAEDSPFAIADVDTIGHGGDP